ncbi:hypothetical protein OJAV_G00195970 [Oryzias javanicus]|uniref:Uncharacterized protein n=1 Tax=Oryzias javanicus TaxID=123683 RepID=A0A437C7A7_ORYJA|nr:hypothetical protein OJAV_G00195970 [Oryzias javanicus]
MRDWSSEVRLNQQIFCDLICSAMKDGVRHVWSRVTRDRHTKTHTSGYVPENFHYRSRRNSMLSADASSSSPRVWEKKEQPVERLDGELKPPLSPAGEGGERL